MNDYLITQHAIQRFQERVWNDSYHNTVSRMKDRLKQATEHVEKRNMSTIAYKGSRYFKHGDCMFVFVENRLVTIYTGNLSEFRPK